MEKKFVRNSITCAAPAARVWEVLVNPEYTRKYMFGCATVSDWKPGSPLLWEMMHEGQPFIPVSGTVLEIEPNKHLLYTVIDPNASYPITPENHLRVQYDLDERDGGTVLTVTQDGFEEAAEGEKRYKDVYNNGEGWAPMLEKIRDVAEEKI